MQPDAFPVVFRALDTFLQIASKVLNIIISKHISAHFHTTIGKICFTLNMSPKAFCYQNVSSIHI